MSPVFKRERGYVFKIYSNEEQRMHIHVIKDDSEAKIWLEPVIELASNDGFAQHEINFIIKKVSENANNFRNQYQKHIGQSSND